MREGRVCSVGAKEVNSGENNGQEGKGAGALGLRVTILRDQSEGRISPSNYEGKKKGLS